MSSFALPNPLLGGDGLFDAYALLQDQRTSGTNGGNLTASTWNTRTLQTEIADDDSIVSLPGSNKIRLQAGRYFVRAWAEAHLCGRHKLRLRNTDDSTTVGNGKSSYANNSQSDGSHSEVATVFTITAQKDFELQHYVENTSATFGQGVATSSGEVEVYANVEIWRYGQNVLATKIGVTDAGNNYDATNLEDVLTEISSPSASMIIASQVFG